MSVPTQEALTEHIARQEAVVTRLSVMVTELSGTVTELKAVVRDLQTKARSSRSHADLMPEDEDRMWVVGYGPPAVIGQIFNTHRQAYAASHGVQGGNGLRTL